jgi:hypothetical protein
MMYAPNEIRKTSSIMTNQLILYIGTPEKGQALAVEVEARGGYVYLPQHLMQALGMYITYMPQIIVIDMALDWAQEAYDHLRSVDAEPLVLLTDQRQRSASVYALPPHISADALQDALEQIHAPQRVPNGFYLYA